MGGLFVACDVFMFIFDGCSFLAVSCLRQGFEVFIPLRRFVGVEGEGRLLETFLWLVLVVLFLYSLLISFC